MVDGIKQKPSEGCEQCLYFEKAHDNAPSKRKTKVEMIAKRDLYEGWYASTTPPQGPWILNDTLAADRRLQMGTVQYHRGLSPANRSLQRKCPAR